MNDSVQLLAKRLSIVTKPIPKPANASDVIIKVSFAGVSKLDQLVLSGQMPASEKAVILGQELSGVVYSVGLSVDHVEINDLVVVNPNSSCQMCSYCYQGRPQFCTTGGIRSTIGVWKNGGWANYCRVPASQVHKVRKETSLAKAVFSEPLSRIEGGWKNLGGIHSSSKILVSGCGIEGLLWTSYLHHCGYRNISVCDTAEEKRNLVSNLNLDVSVHTPESIEEQYWVARQEKNDEWGFDIIVECNSSVKSIEKLTKCMRRGGKLLLFVPFPKDEEIAMNPFEIVLNQLHVIGVHSSPHTFVDGVSLTFEMDSYLDFEKLGVKTFQLQDYPAALEAVESGEITKAVYTIDFSTA